MDETTSEAGFIAWVEGMVSSEGNLLGHHEDAIAVELEDTILVINIDGWVESTDRPEGMSAQDVGYRAVANAISDVIVKGAKPEGMIISSAISDRHRGELRDIIVGFKQASEDFATPYFGGDMNSSSDLVIDVTVWGRTKQLVRRNGAEVGDQVYWLGPDLGCTAAALGILTKGWVGNRERALKVMGRPELYPEFHNLDVHAATDSSDGLAKSLYHISDASEVGINLDGFPPAAKWIEDVAKNNDVGRTDLYLFGGEELGIVFTCEPNTVVPEHVVHLGHVTEGDEVTLRGERIENRGWDHFT